MAKAYYEADLKHRGTVYGAPRNREGFSMGFDLEGPMRAAAAADAGLDALLQYSTDPMADAGGLASWQAALN